MTTLLEKIADDLMRLSPAERLELADTLYGSVEQPMDADVEMAWEKEIDRRVDDYEAGKASVVSAEEAHGRIRKALDEARGLSSRGQR